MKRLMASACLLLFGLAACGAEPDPEPVIPDAVTPQPDTETPGEGEEPASGDEEAEIPGDPYAFFLEDGAIAHYKGEGNEYAQLTKRTVHLAGGHIAVYEDNGGTTVLSVYRLTDDAADLVKEEPEFYEEYVASLEELHALEPISRYFELPIEVGGQMNGMPVKELGVQAETPYKVFDDAILLENKTEDGAIIRSYFAEGYGEVKREFIMSDGENEYEVTSSLEKIQ